MDTRSGKPGDVRQTSRKRPAIIGVTLLLISLILSSWTVRAYFDGRDIEIINSLTGLSSSDEQASRNSDTPSPTISASAQPQPTPTPMPAPDLSGVTVSAQAALVMNADTGDAFFEHEVDTPLPPASTLKIVTALTVVRHVGPEEVVNIVGEDEVDPAEESHMGIQAGDTVTVHDLLVGMLLPSGNDAARALARYVGERLADGSETPPIERFVAEMNRTAADIGMEGSVFAEPTGVHVEGVVSTARDLALAAGVLLEDPALRPIVAMPQAYVRVGGEEPRVLMLSSTNELIREDGVSGVKTGTTVEAGQCLVVAYRGRGHNEILVILGSQDRYVDARALLGLDPVIEAESRR